MKRIYRTIGIAVALLELVLTSGCVEPNGQPNNTGTGALAGGIFGAVVGGLAGGRHAGRDALIGGLAGVVVGGLVGHMIDRDQQQRLQAQSPQTWQTIQHNDAVYQQQQPTAPPSVQAPAPAQAQPAQVPAAPAAALIPLTVDDIKALDAAGVKKEAIIAEIERSKSVYTQADIAALQQSDPNIDIAVIECMKKTGSS
jgi:hypothetical protein